MNITQSYIYTRKIYICTIILDENVNGGVSSQAKSYIPLNFLCKTHQIPKFKRFSSRLVVVFAQAIPAVKSGMKI